MDYEPISVALKFAFLAVLYLFLLWVASSARKDLRRNRGNDDTGRSDSAFGGGGGGGTQDAWLVVEASDSLAPDTRFDLFGGATLGRSAQADVSFEDRYASGVHARVYPRGDRYFVEDMNSTNGTQLNGSPLTGESELADGMRISIGDTTFRFEMDGYA